MDFPLTIPVSSLPLPAPFWTYHQGIFWGVGSHRRREWTPSPDIGAWNCLGGTRGPDRRVRNSERGRNLPEVQVEKRRGSGGGRRKKGGRGSGVCNDLPVKGHTGSRAETSRSKSEVSLRVPDQGWFHRPRVEQLSSQSLNRGFLPLL